jgi:hypothetical protein
VRGWRGPGGWAIRGRLATGWSGNRPPTRSRARRPLSERDATDPPSHAERDATPSLPRALPVTNALCIDADDLYHAFHEGGWTPRLPSFHVDEETESLLSALDGRDLRATFFLPGHFVRGAPGLVRQIVARGHEIASHGTVHADMSKRTLAEFRDDARSSRLRLEDLGGCPVDTYKAPIWSIAADPRAYDALLEAGYRVDHTAMPAVVAALGRRAGDLEPFRHDDLLVVPVTCARVLGRAIPLPGGFYNAWLPRPLLWRLYRGLNQRGLPFNLYFHPFEHSPCAANRGLVKQRSLYISLYAAHAGRYRGLLDRVARNFALAPLREAYARWIAA